MLEYVLAVAVVVTTIMVYAKSKETIVNARRRVTLHYTKWCPYCTRIRPVFAQVIANTPDVLFVELDEDVAKTPGITAYPTIIMIDERGRARKYIGGADYETLLRWVVSP